MKTLRHEKWRGPSGIGVSTYLFNRPTGAFHVGNGGNGMIHSYGSFPDSPTFSTSKSFTKNFGL